MSNCYVFVRHPCGIVAFAAQRHPSKPYWKVISVWLIHWSENQ